MRRVSVVFAMLMLLLASVFVAPVQAARGSASHYTAGRYIVTFADEPVASYTGYKAGFAATQPRAGGKINPNSAAVQKWQKHLTAQHDAALAKVGATKIYDYTLANNGLVAKLTAKQAAALAATPGVIALEKDRLAQPATTTTPEFLGLTAA